MDSREDYVRRRFGSLHQRLVHRRETQVVRELLRSLPSRREVCLDAPCGYGRLTDELCMAGFRRVVCADRNARRLAAMQGSPVGLRALVSSTRVDLLGELPFRSGSFDLVLTIRFLQHVRDEAGRGRLLQELLRITRRHLILSYYETGGLHAMQRRLFRRRRKRPPLATLHSFQLQAAVGSAGGRLLVDRAVLPHVHAQRIVLVEKQIADEQ